MPSIPQSLLWISLVVLWLFVLVPMLINKRDTVRRTSDVALATRVLNGGRSRLLRRTGPATGHRHDPLWRDGEPELDENYDDAEDLEPEDYDEAVRAAVREAESRKQPVGQVPTMMVVAADHEAEATTEPVYIDVDIVDENSGALPVGDTGVQETLFDEPSYRDATAPETIEAETTDAEVVEVVETETADADLAADEYEYVDDSGGLEADDADGEAVDPVVAARSRRRRMESTTAAAVSARKYRFRKRMLTAMAAVMVLTAIASFAVSAAFWWSCGAAGAVTVLYLGYLRRQTRIEEQVRRRRQQRTARSRPDQQSDVGGYRSRSEDRAAGRAADDAASRLRRPGAVVLDIDDEDPVFDHLDEVAYSRRYDLPRAAGQ